jgi:hypothetical protein
MESARAAKDKQSEREIQVRVRSGSKGRDDTWLKHGSFQMKADERACISTHKCTSGRPEVPYRRAESESSPKDSSQRYVAVFFLGVRVALVFEGVERGDDEAASVGGFDDAVEVATFGGDERVGEAVAEFGDFFPA